MTEENETYNGDYHRARIWQIALFALNNTATNMYLFAIGFVTYYATGIAGLTVFFVSTVLAAMRAFDAVTDPIIGFIIDKTETKFGKFRPIMVTGNVLMLISFLILYNVTHTLPEAAQMPFFILIHAIYIIGYTCQTSVTRAAQTVLTNHPKQRPLFTIFDSVYNIALFTGGQIYVASYLIDKHGDFTLELFEELNTNVVAVSGLFTILAVIAIWQKDRKKYFGLGELGVNTRFRDYWPILKKNRAMQMLVVAASTDKLAAQTMQQQVAMVMFFGILLGDYALSGTISLITIAPSLIITYLGVVYARRRGLKRALVYGSWVGFLSFAVLIVIFLFIDPQQISLQNIGMVTVVFLILYSIGRGITTFTPSIVIPMIADVADYEMYRSGRYVPGMIATLFSLVDKTVSSLAPAIVGGLVAVIGFNEAFPTVTDPLTTELYVMSIIIMLGIPMVAWLVSIIAMRFYKLDKEKMEEIQHEMAGVKNQIDEAKTKKEQERKEREREENNKSDE